MEQLRHLSGKAYSLGIEFSTQSVKIVVLDIEKAKPFYTGIFDYDTTFSKYETKGGVLINEDPKIRHASPFMFIEALDYSFKKLKDDGIDLSLVKAVKTDCMQHCTVYVNDSFANIIQKLNPETDMIVQLASTVSRKGSPIWEDRSPIKETEHLTELLLEKGGISNLTGNKAELRFPSVQILKWAKEFPEEYNKTGHIFLLSSFITSILAGKISPVDTGDGWGTGLNNLDINNPGWDKDLLSVMNSYLCKYGLSAFLGEKIGKIDHYDSCCGRINKYFVYKYGVNPEAIVLVGTGDNPATLLGCGGNVVVSLGSSYTVNGLMEEIVPSSTGEYNMFGYTKGRAMALSVFTNGGKLHEYFLRRYILKGKEKKLEMSDWALYLTTAGSPQLNVDEKLMLPYLFDESLPLRSRGVIRNGFSENDGSLDIRSLHISQVLSLRLHSRHLKNVSELCVVGGGSRNRFLRQLIADLFDTNVYSILNASFAAPLGSAISGARMLLNISYNEAARRFVQRDETAVLSPIRKNTFISQVLLKKYSTLENRRYN